MFAFFKTRLQSTGLQNLIAFCFSRFLPTSLHFSEYTGQGPLFRVLYCRFLPDLVLKHQLLALGLVTSSLLQFDLLSHLGFHGNHQASCLGSHFRGPLLQSHICFNSSDPCLPPHISNLSYLSHKHTRRHLDSLSPPQAKGVGELAQVHLLQLLLSYHAGVNVGTALAHREADLKDIVFPGKERASIMFLVCSQACLGEFSKYPALLPISAP